MQNSISIAGLTLFYDSAEESSVGLIKEACEKSVRLIRENLGLPLPEDCRVYIMTSRFQLYHSAPLIWKFFLAVMAPLWVFKVNRMWPYVGGWQQRFGKRTAVGVKPPGLIQVSDRRIGENIYIKEESIEEKVQHITCHELTHAFTSHIKIPTWLREGLAMTMVDKYLSKLTVKSETLETLKKYPDNSSPSLDYSFKDKEALVYLYARSYWLTRYIEETKPELLKELLSGSYRKNQFKALIAGSYGKNTDVFWKEINSDLVSYFK